MKNQFYYEIEKQSCLPRNERREKADQQRTQQPKAFSNLYAKGLTMKVRFKKQWSGPYGIFTKGRIVELSGPMLAAAPKDSYVAVIAEESKQQDTPVNKQQKTSVNK
jgi:hypothetical protein